MSYQLYYGQVGRAVAEKLSAADAEYLLRVDREEYLDWLVAQYERRPLGWHEDHMTAEQVMVKVPRYQPVFGERHVVDEPRLRLRFPLDPHPDRDGYFSLRPSHTWVSGEPEWHFEGDVLLYDVDPTKEAIQRAKEALRFWLGGRNADIEAGNARLRQHIRLVWEAKRQQLEEQHAAAKAVLAELSVPLHQDPNARAKPVEIKRRKLDIVIPPPQPRSPREPALNRSHVIGLVDLIEDYARQFEISPKTYAKMDEEELRDLIMGMMNANYPGSTTAETFNKLGKTDISLRVSPGSVLICECKQWSGAKAYGEALDQLFRYLTWRQNYGVLIHFCRLKEMTRAVSEAKRAMEEHESITPGTIHEVSASRFTSRHRHPQDSEKALEVHHLFIDLSV